MLKKLLAAAAFATMLASPAFSAEKLTVALNWFPIGDHAAYWVALDKGYFADRGLDVTLENSKGSGDAIAKVETGRADIGLADAAVVIASHARGADVKIVGMVFDKTPMNIFSRMDDPVRKPSDLEGKTIGAPAGDAQRQLWPAFAKANNIDMSKVQWVNVEPSAKVAALTEKRVDTVADYTTGLPLYEKVLGKGNVVMMPWGDFGLDMYSMSIIASEKTIKEHPEALRKFLEAAYLGWRDVLTDPDAAMAIFKKRVPEIDEKLLGASLKVAIKLMQTKRYEEHGIGWIDHDKMCHSVDLVNTYMGLPKKVNCDEVYTADFLPKVDMPAR